MAASPSSPAPSCPGGQSVATHRTVPKIHRTRRRAPQRLNAVVGIDLGTSNSAVAVADADGPRIMRDADGNASVPSIVAITQDDEILVGWEAARCDAGPQNTFHSFKRLLGQKAAHVLEEAARVSYAVTEGDQGEAAVYCPAADDVITPEELSGWVLRHVAQHAQQQLREAVTGAVIAVPAHFGRRQREATLEAAARAGLRHVHLLQEPVAAALAYGLGGGADGETVLVFDLGGGTYDVSILQAFEGIMEVLGTGGDSRLGGDDFDAAVADWILAQLGGGGGGAAGCSRRWATAAARSATVQLSRAPQATIEAPDGRRLVLTEELFEEVTGQLLRRLAAPLARLGGDLFVEWATPAEQAVPGSATCDGSSGSSCAGGGGTAAPRTPGSRRNGGGGGSGGGADGQQHVGPGDKWVPPPRRITKVALVGQMTRLPTLRRFVRRVTGVEPCTSVDPGEAVALGAAVQAGVLLGSVGSVELMDGSFVGALHGRVAGFSEWQEP